MVKNSAESSIGVPQVAPLSVERVKAMVLPKPEKTPGKGKRRQTT